jgi:hypothetical protein
VAIFLTPVSYQEQLQISLGDGQFSAILINTQSGAETTTWVRNMLTNIIKTAIQRREALVHSFFIATFPPILGLLAKIRTVTHYPPYGELDIATGSGGEHDPYDIRFSLVDTTSLKLFSFYSRCH